MSDNAKALWTAEMLFGGSRHTLLIANSVTEANRMKQLGEGKAHPLWLVGHLAFGMDALVRGFAMQKKGVVEKEWIRKFAPDIAGGGPITSNADDYPSWDAVIKKYDEVSEMARDELATLSDKDLDKSLKGIVPDAFFDMFPTTGLTIHRGGIDHDAYHRGQIALINKL